MRLDRTFYMVAMVILAVFLCTTEVYANSMTAIAEEGGIVTPSGKIVGDSGSVTITPDTISDRYQVNDVLLYEGTKVSANKLVGSVLADCNFDGLVATYSYAGLGADYTISASFVLAPVASFEIDSASPPSDTEEPDVTVQFNDTSTNSPTSWLWDFGDDTTSTEQSPMHTYTSAGTFPVTLSVYNSQSTQPIDTATIDYIVVQPTITYQTTAGPNGSISAAGPNGSLTPPDGPYTVPEDTITTFTIIPEEYYRVANVQAIDESGTVYDYGTATSVSFDGSNDLADYTIVASFEPIPVVASFSGPSGEITTTDEVTFTDTSQGPLSSRTWYINDVEISTGPTLLHTFSEAGPYRVTLKVGNPAVTFQTAFEDYLVESSYSSSPIMQESTLAGYISLQSAYDDIALKYFKDKETVKIKAVEPISENLIFDKNIMLTLLGGYVDELFEVVGGFSRIHGHIIIKDGTVYVSNVIIGL